MKSGILVQEFIPFLIKQAQLKNIEHYKHPNWVQKILFLIQFEYINQGDFFQNKFESFIYGPVNREVYFLQKNDHKWKNLPQINNEEELKIYFETHFISYLKDKSILNMMWKSFEKTFKKYGNYSGYYLMKYTKNFECWKNNFPTEFRNEYLLTFYKNNIISSQDMKNEWKKQNQHF